MAAFKAGKKDVLIATDVAARGIDVDDVTHVINHTIPDDEKTYLHRAGRTGRAGKTGIAVTFVDWDDLHKWALINRALEFGQPEPVETYSSSPHLYTDLDIPAGTKGRTRDRAAHADGQDAGCRGPRERRRFRTLPPAASSGRERIDQRDQRRAERRAQVPAEHGANDAADGAGTHDGGGKEHHDGNAGAPSSPSSSWWIASRRRAHRRRSHAAAGVAAEGLV